MNSVFGPIVVPSSCHNYPEAQRVVVVAVALVMCLVETDLVVMNLVEQRQSCWSRQAEDSWRVKDPMTVPAAVVIDARESSLVGVRFDGEKSLNRLAWHRLKREQGLPDDSFALGILHLQKDLKEGLSPLFGQSHLTLP